MRRRIPAGRLLAGLGLAGALAGCGPVAPASADASLAAPKVQVHMISREVSRAMGERGYAELIESLAGEDRIEKDVRVNQRVQAIMARLVRQAVAAYPFSRDWSWEIRVVRDDMVNAYCLPGGKMILNTGLLALTRFDEHKLATVLGHEIAHALLEHGRTRAGHGAVIDSTLEVLAQSFKMGRLRLIALGEGLKPVTLPLQREHEREADLLGLDLMARAGFNPIQGASLWVDMRGEEPAPLLAQRLEGYLSDHPSDSERLATLTEAARRLAAARKASR